MSNITKRIKKFYEEKKQKKMVHIHDLPPEVVKEASKTYLWRTPVFVDKEFEAFLPDVDFGKYGYEIFIVDKQYLKELEESKKKLKREFGWEK